MTTRKAITTALGCLSGRTTNPAEARDAAKTLADILEQKGCEHLDAAVEDGRLTTLLDVIVYG